MGRGASFICKTCKKTYYLGYGSYSTWLDRKTLDELKSLNSNDNENMQLKKNQNVLKCLEEHQEHDYYIWNEDELEDKPDKFEVIDLYEEI